MDGWVKYRCPDWVGFRELPSTARRAFKEIEECLKEKGRHTYNILLMGNHRVGKTSTVENIVKMGNSPSAHESQMHPADVMPGVLSFIKKGKGKGKGSFTLNFIDTKQCLDTGGCYDVRPLMLIAAQGFVDVILYVDRADVYSMNATDLFVANTIAKLFGPEAWDRVVIVLTHFDALEESTKYEFCRRRMEELFNWIVKGGDIEEDHVKDTLKDRVALIANAKKCKERIVDVPRQISFLVNKMAEIAIKNKDAGPLKVRDIPQAQGGYLHFFEEIWDNCENKYFEIFCAGDSKGSEEWNSFIFDGQRSNDILATLNPEEWKTDHLPESALQFIEDVKSFSENENKANGIEGNSSFTILVMGRGGVGKSSTANSIIGADVFPVNKTKGSQEILIWSGTYCNFTLRIIEIPEFMHYGQVHQGYFEAIQEFWKVYKINALLYVDRLDEWKRDDLSSKTMANIASFFGPRILNRTLIVLTHRISSAEGQIELRSKRTKSMIVRDAAYSIFMCECKVEEDALEAVAVDTSEYLPGKKSPEWMDGLFKGLNKIWVREREPPLADEERLNADDWILQKDHTFFSWLGREEVQEKKVRVMISVR